MRVSHFPTIFLSLIILSDVCSGDANIETWLNCPESESANDTSFQANLRSLLSSLIANAPSKRGFHESSSNHKDHEVVRLYGLVQCRGDISAVDCSSCLEDSARAAAEKCPASRDVSVWLRWCFLRYSDEDFLGTMDKTSVSRTNESDFDDLSVVSKGLELMAGLALTAPKRALMFEAREVDVGPAGKRFGMAQCNRDIDRVECSKCLHSQLADFKTTVWNKRGWEIYGLSCSMWYHDYRFYFNVSVDANRGVARLPSGNWFRVMVAVLALVMVF